jgi:hypothetical protein
MKQEGKDKIITRAIHFIATNTKDDSYRIGRSIIAELELVKNLTIPDIVVTREEIHMCHARKGKECIKPTSCKAFGCNKQM